MDEPWIQTYYGVKYPITNPNVDAIGIEDIAHALSNNCRFSGHVKTFYSVAQHSVLCSLMIAESFALEALLHDASEAYLVDIPRPLKLSGVMDRYRELESKTEKVLSQKFGTPFPMSSEVKEIDNRMLLTEQRDLMGPQLEPWEIKAEPFIFKINCWTPQQAEREFLSRYRELTYVPS